VSEFGAQSVPVSADFIDASAWPDLPWDELAERHGLQRWVFDERVPPDRFATFDEWRRATQTYQAELLRHQIETLRRLKYRPSGGFCMFALNDPAPMVSWSVLDHLRVPKPGFDALRRSCRPVVVVADRPPDFVVPGDDLSLDVHVVNDLRRDLGGVIDVVVAWAGGSRRWRFVGDVPADDCVRVGRIELDVPATLGALTVDLSFTADGVSASNHYSTAVTVTRG
jgi:beta-mannosidase